MMANLQDFVNSLSQIYGFEQGFRNQPQLPCQVYRLDVISGDIRVVADGFGRPNGLCFSPDEKTLYVTGR